MSSEALDVLRIITRLNAGGPSRHVSILEAGLRAIGLRSLLVHGSLAAGEAAIDPVPKGPQHSLASLQRIPSPLRDYQTLRSLRALLREHEPRLIHTHQGKAGLLGRWAASERRDCRVVHTFHGHTFQGYWGSGFRRALIAIERRLARTSDVLIAQSPSQREEIVQVLGEEQRDKFHIVAPAIDFQLLDERAADNVGFTHYETYDLCFAARWAPVKDPLAYLRLVSRLSKSRPALRAAMAGRGDAKMNAAVIKLQDDLELHDHVDQLGHLGHPARAFSRSRIVVNCSLNEGTPLALIEALALGADVATYAVGGIEDLIGNLEGCRLVAPQDEEGLAKAVIELEEERDSVDRRRRRVELESRYGASRLVADMSALYSSLGVKASSQGR